MINQKGTKVLVVASIDGNRVGPGAEAGRFEEDQGYRVRPVDQPDQGVDYYATFDNYKVGQLQGEYIVKQLGLDQGKGPFTWSLRWIS